ncbi:hypothetical protein GCM10023089_29510 [Quisquiliibacterium transsilvanicum]
MALAVTSAVAAIAAGAKSAGVILDPPKGGGYEVQSDHPVSQGHHGKITN